MGVFLCKDHNENPSIQSWAWFLKGQKNPGFHNLSRLRKDPNLGLLLERGVYMVQMVAIVRKVFEMNYIKMAYNRSRLRPQETTTFLETQF